MPMVLYTRRCLFSAIVHIVEIYNWTVYCLTLIELIQVFIQKFSFWSIVPMAAICYSDPILMIFNMHCVYMKKVRCSEFCWNILKINKIRPIVCMAASRYIVLILVIFYMHSVYIEKVRCNECCCNIFKNNQNQPIVSMTAIRYIVTILMKFNMHSVYMERVRCSKFGCNILQISKTSR